MKNWLPYADQSLQQDGHKSESIYQDPENANVNIDGHVNMKIWLIHNIEDII
jgi:hypothetical protein